MTVYMMIIIFIYNSFEEHCQSFVKRDKHTIFVRFSLPIVYKLYEECICPKEKETIAKYS